MNLSLNYILFLIVWLFNIDTENVSKNSYQNGPEIVIDCNYTFNDAVKGLEIPKSILNQLTIIDVEYFSFDNKLHRGQIVLNKQAVNDIKAVFEIIREIKFPINKVIPVVYYNWLDEESMNDDNTSAFNYRKVKDTKVISAHSYGLAIDINPMQNPHIKNGVSKPINGKYDIKSPGTILKDSKIVKEFKKRGWQWGGSWRSSKDYQHFEKKN